VLNLRFLTLNTLLFIVTLSCLLLATYFDEIGESVLSKIIFFLSLVSVIPWGIYKNYTGLSKETEISKKIILSYMSVFTVIVLASIIAANFKWYNVWY